jgi:hypothetical protein
MKKNRSRKSRGTVPLISLLIGLHRRPFFASHWLDECANSTPTNLTSDPSYIQCLGLVIRTLAAVPSSAVS